MSRAVRIVVPGYPHHVMQRNGLCPARTFAILFLRRDSRELALSTAANSRPRKGPKERKTPRKNRVCP